MHIRYYDMVLSKFQQLLLIKPKFGNNAISRFQEQKTTAWLVLNIQNFITLLLWTGLSSLTIYHYYCFDDIDDLMAN